MRGDGGNGRASYCSTHTSIHASYCSTHTSIHATRVDISIYMYISIYMRGKGGASNSNTHTYIHTHARLGRRFHLQLAWIYTYTRAIGRLIQTNIHTCIHTHQRGWWQRWRLELQGKTQELQDTGTQLQDTGAMGPFWSSCCRSNSISVCCNLLQCTVALCPLIFLAPVLHMYSHYTCAWMCGGGGVTFNLPAAGFKSHLHYTCRGCECGCGCECECGCGCVWFLPSSRRRCAYIFPLYIHIH